MNLLKELYPLSLLIHKFLLLLLINCCLEKTTQSENLFKKSINITSNVGVPSLFSSTPVRTILECPGFKIWLPTSNSIWRTTLEIKYRMDEVCIVVSFEFLRRYVHVINNSVTSSKSKSFVSKWKSFPHGASLQYHAKSYDSLISKWNYNLTKLL